MHTHTNLQAAAVFLYRSRRRLPNVYMYIFTSSEEHTKKHTYNNTIDAFSTHSTAQRHHYHNGRRFLNGLYKFYLKPSAHSAACVYLCVHVCCAVRAYVYVPAVCLFACEMRACVFTDFRATQYTIYYIYKRTNKYNTLRVSAFK